MARSSISNSFTADVKGGYKVSLKVTDLAGKSDLAIVDIDVPNLLPSAYIVPESNEYANLGENYEFVVYFGDDSKFVDTSNEQVSISYEWHAKPAGSSTEVTLTSSEITVQEMNYGILISKRYSILADTVGSYTLKFNTVDFEGKSSSDSITFEIL